MANRVTLNAYSLRIFASLTTRNGGFYIRVSAVFVFYADLYSGHKLRVLSTDNSYNMSLDEQLLVILPRDYACLMYSFEYSLSDQIL